MTPLTYYGHCLNRIKYLLSKGHELPESIEVKDLKVYVDGQEERDEDKLCRLITRLEKQQKEIFKEAV